jgi:hypothetical protein
MMQDIHYSPHFAFLKKNRKVDEFHGSDIQRLRDRMWLHDDSRTKKASPSDPAKT